MEFFTGEIGRYGTFLLIISCASKGPEMQLWVRKCASADAISSSKRIPMYDDAAMSDLIRNSFCFFFLQTGLIAVLFCGGD